MSARLTHMCGLVTAPVQRVNLLANPRLSHSSMSELEILRYYCEGQLYAGLFIPAVKEIHEQETMTTRGCSRTEESKYFRIDDTGVVGRTAC